MIFLESASPTSKYARGSNDDCYVPVCQLKSASTLVQISVSGGAFQTMLSLIQNMHPIGSI